MKVRSQQLHAYHVFYDTLGLPCLGHFERELINDEYFVLIVSAKASPYLHALWQEEHRLFTQNRAGESEAQVEIGSCHDDK